MDKPMRARTRSLVDQVVLVTGAARGIGAAGAAELYRRGAQVVLTDVDVATLNRTAEALGPDVLALPLDVTDAAACEATVAEVAARRGRIDVVWANAGIASFGPLADTDPRAWDRTVEVNLLGTARTVRAALPEIVATRGYVAVTASLASFAAMPGGSAYCASKSGVEAMANALRLEVAHLGVDVGTIHPTWIDTDMVRDGDENPAFARLRAAFRPPFARTYPVEQAATLIADGIERRSRRICVPGFVRLAHALRPLLTTRLFERDERRVAPEVVAVFREMTAARGPLGASVSTRIAAQQFGVHPAAGRLPDQPSRSSSDTTVG
jgi:NAD(P)-dependent dehydrogenase (short-subunit alcohol dehydrogenase family)